jgi:hypothetical protein
VINQGFVMGLAVSSLLLAQRQPPADLAARLDKARVDGTVVGWCQAQFEAGRTRAYAAAVAASDGGGRYLVVDDAGTIIQLAPFKGAPDLACYTPADARKLDDAIRSSKTISGRIAPLFPTTIVCAFVEDTEAVCWQYSPKLRGFTVGQWQT